MKIAIASGKGGTGKTMVTASLAACWEADVTAVDLDVEEPNLHLFLDPDLSEHRTATLAVPEVDESRCTFCRACADLCQFKAISILGSVAMVFPEMCHGCGGCMAVCPAGAITTTHRVLGEISRGRSAWGEFLMGRLRVGEAMSPPLIKAVLGELDSDAFDARGDVLIDAPPGVSCPAISAVMDSDIIVLVTEPTPFGLFDLRLAHEAFLPLRKPMGVVVNRAGMGNDAVYEFCRKVQLPVWAEIPYDRAIAEAYANGLIVARSVPRWTALFSGLARTLRDIVTSEDEVRYA